MVKPTKPTAPAQALRSNPDTFPARAEENIAFAFGTLPTYIDAAMTYAETQVDAATAAALGGDLPALTGNAGKFLRVNSGETGAEFLGFTAAGLALLDDTTAAAQRLTLGAAPLASPAFAGTPTAPTATAGTATTQLATTAFAIGAVTEFGLGVIGAPPVLAAIDATTTASGMYSYTTGATGTFPSGVTAAAGGVITVYRESTTAGYMTLHPTGGYAIYFRRLSTTWMSWDIIASEDVVGVANSRLVKTAINASGSAPIYACRAWVKFSGNSPGANIASGNISSVTDNCVGSYTINFTTAMQDSNYAATGLSSSGTVILGTAAAGSQTITTVSSSGAAIDPSNVELAVFR